MGIDEAAGSGVGLRSMRERAEELGGFTARGTETATEGHRAVADADRGIDVGEQLEQFGVHRAQS